MTKMTTTESNEEMEKRIVWKPAHVSDNDVGTDKLAQILSKAYELPFTLATSDIDYLRGLRDSGVEGAQDLITAIGYHRLIEVRTREMRTNDE